MCAFAYLIIIHIERARGFNFPDRHQIASRTNGVYALDSMVIYVIILTISRPPHSHLRHVGRKRSGASSSISCSPPSLAPTIVCQSQYVISSSANHCERALLWGRSGWCCPITLPARGFYIERLANALAWARTSAVGPINYHPASAHHRISRLVYIMIIARCRSCGCCTLCGSLVNMVHTTEQIWMPRGICPTVCWNLKWPDDLVLGVHAMEFLYYNVVDFVEIQNGLLMPTTILL